VKELLPLFGIVTVLNTPFKDDGSIDIESLEKHVDYAIEAGVSGILYPAMASEVNYLTEYEKIEGIKAVMATNQNKVKVIGGCYGKQRADRLKMAEKLIDLGVDGILINLPYNNMESFISELKEIDKINPSFLMVQDWDDRGYGIPLDVIENAFNEIESFRVLKIEVVGSCLKYTDVINRTKGLLNVSGGWAVMHLIEALDRGVHCFIPTALHEIYVRIYELYRTGNRESAKDLFYRLLPVINFSNQSLDISIIFFKRATNI